eukprot:143885_1
MAASEETSAITDDAQPIEEAPITDEPQSELLPPIVLDNGGGLLKAGLSTTENPYCVQSLVGTPKHSRVMLSAPSTNKFFGNSAFKHRGLCKLSHPIQNGLITHWNDMIQLWQYLYDDILQIDTKQHPLLITEAPKNPISNRIRIAQIHLEFFESPSIYFVPPSVLALYATGRLSGCVLDSGHGVSTCVPIVDGYAIPHAITRMDIGGLDITQYLGHILRKCGDYNFRTSSELQTVRIIKEKECILNKEQIDSTLNPSYHSTGIMGIHSSGNLLSSKLSTLSGKLGSSFNLGLGSKSGSVLTGRGAQDDSPQYTLPDGTILNIGNTHQRAAEILFEPALIGYTKSRGIHYLVLNAISKCDIELRNSLYPNIYLVGGNCNIKNFGERLLRELKKKVDTKKNNRNVRIKSHAVAKSNTKHLIPYIGGTLIASNSVFKDLAITREEFDEYGASILFRRA